MMRWKFVAAVVLLGAAPARAQPASPMDPLYACAAIAADSERLKCFDTALAKLKASEQTGDVTVVDQAGMRTLEKDSFGFHLPSLGALFSRKGGSQAASAPTGVDQVSAKITRTSRTADGAIYVLDNGQTWRQIDTTGTPPIRAGDAIIVKRASMGSFLLMRASGGEGVRVRRVE